MSKNFRMYLTTQNFRIITRVHYILVSNYRTNSCFSTSNQILLWNPSRVYLKFLHTFFQRILQ